MDELEEKVQSAVYMRQIQLLYANQPHAVVTMALLLTILLSFLGISIAWAELLVWAVLFALVLVIRMVSTLVFHRRNRRHTVDYRKAELFYLGGVVLTAACWAAMIISLYPILDFTERLLMITVILGVVTASHVTMGYRMLPYQSHSLIVLLSAIYAVHGSDFPGAEVITLGGCLFIFFIFGASVNFYRNITNMLRTEERSILQKHKLMMQREQAHLESQAKSQFLSRMSHELRTPLNAVMGLNELQMRDKGQPLSPVQYERASKIRDASNHLLTLVNDVLDLSKIETDSMTVRVQSVDCIALMMECLELVEVRADVAGVNLEFEEPADPVWVRADRQRLKQVMLNLLDNAIKYNSARGKVTVSLSGAGGDCWRISVSDTGPGIPEGRYDEVFMPFTRLEDTRDKTDGVGVGLSFSKKLVELMSGRIGLESARGGGSTFWVEMPVAQPLALTVGETGIRRASPATDVAHRRPRRGGKLLLVEDNQVNQEVANEMLVDLGLDVDVANNGIEALEMIAREDYAAILMDYQMPVLDGISATRELRKREREAGIAPVPVIAVTAHAIQGARKQCLDAGMDEFLSKPFNYDELRQVISNWVVLPGDATGESSPDDAGKAGDDNSMVIDPAALARLKTGKRNLVKRIVSSYLDQTPGMLETIESCARSRDTENLSLQVHILKSSCLTVGAVQMADSCRRIEALCKQGEIDSEEIRYLLESYEAVSQELGQIVESGKLA